MDAAAELPAWLRALEPLSVPFVILLMLAGWLLEVRRLKERRDAADARIAGLAFVVRRTLEKSLEEPWIDESGRDRNTKKRATDVREGFVEHEPRVEAMLSEAAGASGEVAEDVRTASRLFWSAASGVNEAADAGLKVASTGARGEIQRRAFRGDEEAELRQARSTTEDCVEVLQRLDAPVREAG